MNSGDAVRTSEERVADGPLAGKTVAVVHAAWHSCGSYQVNLSQIYAYKALGARAISVALMDVPSPPPPGGRWADYIAATKDLAADARYYASPPRGGLWTSRLLIDGWWPLIHGDQARWLIELAKLAPLPAGLETERIDLIHANHYFTLPLARRLRGAAKAPIICETQDIQGRQYVLRNQSGFFVPPYASYDDMLAVELDWTGRADVCIHLNEEEHREFGRLLPKARHALVYPAVAPVPLSEKGRGIVIVASDNYANFVSLRWFLNEVLPLAGDVPVSIYGNIDAGAKNRDRALYEAHRALFKGRVADLGAVYADAACILLPTVEGHGLSIKAVEALSSGAPLIATTAAFRGMGVDPSGLANVTLREDAPGFAAALRETSAKLRAGASPRDCATSDTRRLYDAVFSPRAYADALARIAVPLLERATPPAPRRANGTAMTTMRPPAVIGVVTASDRASAGVYADESGPAIEAYFRKVLTTPFRLERRIIPDGFESVRDTLIDLADIVGCDLIVTTGGTGPSPRDLTPEATLAAAPRELPGFGELMRKVSLEQVPTAILSRQLAAHRGKCLIINLPGKPAAIELCLDAVMPAVPYCLDLIGAAWLDTDPARVKTFRPKAK